MRRILINEGNETELEMLDLHIDGKVSKKSIILYSKLIGRANAQMTEKLRLPVHHYSAFRGLYKDYYRE